MKNIIYNIQKSFQRNALCLIAVGLAFPAFAQDDLTEDAQEEVVARKRPEVKQEKYQLTAVKGRILDEVTKKPLGGIQVKALANSRYTAMSDDDGTFTIKVPHFVTSLYVYAQEYSAQQVSINTDSKAEVVVYMLNDKFRPMYKDATNITASREFNAKGGHEYTIDTEIENQLSGDLRSIKHSGSVGVGNSMFVRGLNSINANSQPLVIVDGVEMDMQLSREMLHSGNFNNMLANVMPSDIEKVTVLKNATALYGARGANGVILIDTKRGHSMATRIDANISVGLTLVPKLQTMMNAYQYRNYVTEVMGTMPGLDKYTPSLNFLNDDPNGYFYHTYHNDYDWQDDVYQTALTQNYSINVQGGDDVGMYNLSVGYVDGESTAKGNDYSRMNVRFNTDIDILRNLRTKFNMSISRTTTNTQNDGVQEDFTTATPTSPTFLAAIKSPLVAPYQYSNNLGRFTNLLSDHDDLFDALGSGYSLANPIAILANAEGVNRNYTENIYFQVAVAPTLKLGKDWSITESFSYLLNRNSQRYTRPSSGVPGFEMHNIGTVYNKFATLFSNENNIISDTRVDYSHIFGAHTLSAFAGFRYSRFSFNSDAVSTEYTSRQPDKDPHISADAQNVNASGGVEDVWKQIQWYGNIDYNYKNRYFLTLSLLGEANSRFGLECDGLDMFGAKWEIYPSVQAGWVATNEKWFPKNTVLDYLRINAGFDVSGNDDIMNNAARTIYASVKFNNFPGSQLVNIGNDKIKAERTNKFNVGFQSYWLHNRIGLSFDYYIHKTTDLLTLKSFSDPIAGINKYWTNGGELKNTGFEVAFSAKPVVSKNWNVEIGASIGHYKNEVTKLPEGDYTSSIYGTSNILTSVGNPVAVFYGYKTAGVFATDEQAKAAGKAEDGGYLYFIDNVGSKQQFKAGDVHFVDKDGDGIIGEDDRFIIGDPNPDIYGNIFATVNWKNFTLSMNFNYSLGNDVFNYQRMVYNSGSNFYNQQVAMTNHWRYEGQVTDMPRVAFGDPMMNNRFSDRWIEEGSYLRLKTLNLAYKVPVNWSWLQGLTVWAEAVNLFTLTKYLGSDPEFSINNGVMYQGIDCGNLAQSRAFTLGLKINL